MSNFVQSSQAVSDYTAVSRIKKKINSIEKTSINFDQMDTSKNNNYLQTVANNKIFD